MHSVGFRAFKSPLYQHKRANRPDQNWISDADQDLVVAFHPVSGSPSNKKYNKIACLSKVLRHQDFLQESTWTNSQCSTWITKRTLTKMKLKHNNILSAALPRKMTPCFACSMVDVNGEHKQTDNSSLSLNYDILAFSSLRRKLSANGRAY